MKDKTFIKNPTMPASPGQCINLMRLTGKYWAEKKDDGTWVGLITKGEASALLDKLFATKGTTKHAEVVAEVLAQHPLGENATGPAKPEPKTPRASSGLKLPDGITEEIALELFGSFILGRLVKLPDGMSLSDANALFARKNEPVAAPATDAIPDNHIALPEGISADAARTMFDSMLGKTNIVFDSENARNAALEILGKLPDDVTAERIVVLKADADIAKAIGILTKYEYIDESAA